jgi:hypothetical protein
MTDDTKNPKRDANNFAKIKRHNYLAHTIREVEHEIHLRKRISYHVATKMVDVVDYASITFFYRSGCIIFLPEDCEKINNEDARLVLAHELGHISYNIDGIEQMSGLNVSPPNEEECYAWLFAHSLIYAKSDDYKNGVGIDEYIYSDDELHKLLMHNLIRQQPDNKDLHDTVRRSL